MNLTRNSLGKSFFPGDLEGRNSLKIFEKKLSGNYFRNNFVSEGSCYRKLYSMIFLGELITVM